MKKVYGIKNCNTVKKGLSWLEEKGVAFEFHDYKKAGISPEKLYSWIDQVGWEKLVNKKGMTWRKLSDEEKAAVIDADAAVKLMQDKTSVIKRPLIEEGDSVLVVGFDPEEYSNNINV